MDFATILPIDEIFIEKTIIIRQNKKIGLGNAIIAATAIVNNLTILNRNVVDFKNIENLKVLKSYNL